LTPVALLSSNVAVTAMVWPEMATAVPKKIYPDEFEALR
jgi:hypothetical protein